MKVVLTESGDIGDWTEICCLTEDNLVLAKEVFAGVGFFNETVLFRQCVKKTLKRAGILLGSELDHLAQEFNSTADVVRDDTYKIVDLLNYSMEDFRNGTAESMYFRRIPNTRIHGGLYRQLIGNELLEFEMK